MATVDMNERPLIMPENYNFSARSTNWSDYKKSFILRTDAVWEKYKMYAYFYNLYKYVSRCCVDYFRTNGFMKTGSITISHGNMLTR